MEERVLNSKVLTLLFILQAVTFAVLDWLDSHRFVAVLFVLTFSIALLMWSFTLGPASPPSLLPTTTDYYPYILSNVIL